MWKDFFYFSKTEKQGIIVLVILIGIVTCIDFGLSLYRRSQTTIVAEDFQEKYIQFMASVRKQDSIRANRFAKPDFYDKQDNRATIVLSPFDPNTADSLTFSAMGLPGWMARNILRYRSKGGVFRKPEDFRKIYGLSEEQYITLQPYIYISEKYQRKDTIRIIAEKKILNADSNRIFKYPEGTIVSLNQADTTELKKIPGIGSAIARRIVGYRNRLGGYHHISQLQEIDLIPDQLTPWFNIQKGETKRINLNKAGVERLKAHPYFNFYQAKVIVEHRKKKGNLKRLDQLAFYEEFTPNDLERIEPYICFE